MLLPEKWFPLFGSMPKPPRMDLRVASLYRYPVKGLSPERLARADLVKGCYFPADRLFAVENGPSGFDAAVPQHQPKIKFLMLMRNEALARLTTRYDDAAATLDDRGGRPRGCARRPLPGRRPSRHRGLLPPLHAARAARRAQGARRSGRASASRIRAGASSRSSISPAFRRSRRWPARPSIPLRFRGNIHIEGLAPWREFDLVGRVLEGPSGVRLKVTKRIERCAATNVDPATGQRDLAIPKLLMSRLGHADCGVYAEVLSGGSIAEGERLIVEAPAQADLPLS